MPWANVLPKIKLWGAVVLGPGGTPVPYSPDGTPATVNGISVTTGYTGVIDFPAGDKQVIVDAIQDLYQHSPIAAALLDKGAAANAGR